MATPYIGEIRLVGFNFAPQDWAFCNGQALPIAQYDTLFTLIGTTYGGDGQNTFNLPDLRSRVPLHYGGGFVQGQVAGAEAVGLSGQQIPSHSHIPLCVGEVGETGTPGTSAVWAGSARGGLYGDQAPSAAMGAATIAPAGGGQGHSNIQPYLALNYIIALFGIYPSQS